MHCWKNIFAKFVTFVIFFCRLVILAGDVTPVDVMIHLPAVCEDKDIPYCYVPSKEDIGTAMGVTRGVIAILIIDHSDIQENFAEVLAEIQALPIPF